jgi:hypothetical protein
MVVGLTNQPARFIMLEEEKRMNETTPRDIPAEVRAEIESDPLVGIIAEDGRYFGPYHDETTDTVYDGLGRPVDVEAAVEQSRRWIRETCRQYEHKYGLSSHEFFRLWQGGNGQVEDTAETTEWVSLYQHLNWANDSQRD